MNLPEFLKHSRKRRDYTLATLADMTGLSVAYLSDLERGVSDPSLKTLQIIAKAYDMGAGDLLVEAGYSVRCNREDERRAQAKEYAREALDIAYELLDEFGYTPESINAEPR